MRTEASSASPTRACTPGTASNARTTSKPTNVSTALAAITANNASKASTASEARHANKASEPNNPSDASTASHVSIASGASEASKTNNASNASKASTANTASTASTASNASETSVGHPVPSFHLHELLAGRLLQLVLSGEDGSRRICIDGGAADVVQTDVVDRVVGQRKTLAS